jgi:DNA adenine methylase
MPPAVPQPIPYQGSKRLLARHILAFLPAEVGRLVEPFAGSGAVSLAAAQHGRAERFLLGDSLAPLVEIWRGILEDPEGLCDAYEALWAAQHGDPRAHYLTVREAFNRDREPVALLYLLARCVKGAVRFNRAGGFNQAADHRRRGVRPDTMRDRVRRAHALLTGRTALWTGDYAALLAQATPDDLIYMDPPYMGVSGTRDARYHQGLDLARFVAVIEGANARGLRFLISFDGRLGQRRYGPELPATLGLHHLELPAGRSSQATLAGRSEGTVESLYLSPALVRALDGVPGLGSLGR